MIVGELEEVDRSRRRQALKQLGQPNDWEVRTSAIRQRIKNIFLCKVASDPHATVDNQSHLDCIDL
jgi:hypothetical protein